MLISAAQPDQIFINMHKVVGILLCVVLAASFAECANMKIQGVNLFPFDADVLGTPALLGELEEIQQIGANFVVVNFLIEQNGANGSNVGVGASTPTNSAMTTFINAAHKLGLGVFLKPVIVCGDTCIMVNVSPTNVSEWFASYTSYITSLATFAESLEVEVLSVALEVPLLSGKYQGEWEAVIAQVRENFSGNLTYCSIMWPVETQQVVFWDSLDFISMDTYVPFWNGTGPVPTLELMNERFSGYLGVVNSWHQSQAANVSSKPIVLSELGYPSMLQGLIEPFANPPDECATTGLFAPNFTVQALAFDAALSALGTTDANVQGVNIFWFDNPTSSDYYPNRTEATNDWGCGWTVRGKPAEQIIAKMYGGSNTVNR